MNRSINLIVIHASATKPTQDIGARELDRMHRARGFLKIGYHYVIRRNGVTERGRPDEEAGAHAARFNARSIGICLVGGLNDISKPASNFEQEQWQTLATLVRQLKTRYPGSRIVGHRDLSPDKNGDGRITANEYMKECPCFDVASWLVEAGIS